MKTIGNLITAANRIWEIGIIIYFPATSKQGFHFRQTTFDGNNSHKVDRLGQVTQVDMPHISGFCRSSKAGRDGNEGSGFSEKQVRTQWKAIRRQKQKWKPPPFTTSKSFSVLYNDDTFTIETCCQLVDKTSTLQRTTPIRNLSLQEFLFTRQNQWSWDSQLGKCGAFRQRSMSGNR